jgi:hypothetical protein
MNEGLNKDQKIDALYKILNTAYIFQKQLTESGDEWEAELSFIDGRVIMAFISIYCIFYKDDKVVEDMTKEIDTQLFFDSYYNFEVNKKRDDEGVMANNAILLLYYYMIFNHTTFTLGDEFLFQADQFIDKITYLYNTENEDGNKIEYDDLPQKEKIYTDMIMNHIQELYNIKKDVMEVDGHVDFLTSIADIKKYNNNDVVNYLQDSINILFNCYSDAISVAVECMIETFKTYLVIYTENYLDNDIDVAKDIHYKQHFLEFLTNDLYHEFMINITDFEKYFKL